MLFRSHEKILAASANPLLLQMYQTLSGRIRRARYVANMSSERWSQAVKEHEEMLNALAARDGPLLPLITETLSPERYILERHLCVDTTAAGGNASLVASSE